MAAFEYGDIARGGENHFIQVIHADTSFSQMIHVLDDLGGDTQQYIMGVTFRPPTNELFSVSTPSQTMPFVQHDIDWIPDDSGLLVAVVPSPGQLLFRKVNFDGDTIIDEWEPNIEPGWAQQPVKITVACDSRTVLYTQSLHKVQAYDLVSRTNLADYETIPYDSPYIYGGIRLLPEGMTTVDGKHFIVAMSLTGNGPRRAVCLDSDGENHWVDEINTPDLYHIQKRTIFNGTFVLEVQTRATDDPDSNDRTLSLACLYGICPTGFMPIIVTLVGAT